MDRRRAAALASAAGLSALFGPAQAQTADEAAFLAEAFRMRDQAVASGDQPYGAVVVVGGRIVGQGRSRVVADRNADHHAERVALWDAQQLLNRQDVTGAVIYSTAIPCMVCQPVLARAGVSRMVYGRNAVDGGAPKSGG